MSDNLQHRVVSDTDPDILALVLRPYIPQCRYVLSTRVEVGRSRAEGEAPSLVGVYAQCAIPATFYIEDTGHFNAVEFNLCYNQLAYYGIAAAVKHGLLDVFAGWDMDEYRRRQLPDVLISKLSSHFIRPVHGASFEGWLDFTKASTSSKGHIFLTMDVCFTDSHDGLAKGEVTLAIVSRSAK